MEQLIDTGTAAAVLLSIAAVFVWASLVRGRATFLSDQRRLRQRQPPALRRHLQPVTPVATTGSPAYSLEPISTEWVEISEPSSALPSSPGTADGR